MKNTQHTLALIVASILLLWISSCKDISGPGDDGSPIVFPDSGVSFIKEVEPLFEQLCTGCHGGASPAAGLDLTTPSYSRIRSHQPVLVITGDPDNSYLYQRLTGAIQPQMPFNRRPLTQNQLNGIRTWIVEGAGGD